MIAWLKSLLQRVGSFSVKVPIPAEKPLDLSEASRQWHKVNASSFADTADVAAYRRCKARGKSDQECFKVGDNGIGFTGMDCSREDKPMCALPVEVWAERWGKKINAAGRTVLVRYNGKVIAGVLGDTMPKLANIKNGCGIDLNPSFAKALGLRPPFKVAVEWAWG